MAEKFDCKRLYVELERIKEKRAEFGRVYKDGIKKRDFGECRTLFREIRNLLDGPEGEISKLRLPEVLRQLKLEEQYQSQVEVAWKSGLFGADENQNSLNKAENGHDSVRVENPALAVAHRMPVIERGGKKYPMPRWWEVWQNLRKPENLEIIKEKSAQGFTKMLIVPFGYDLKTMAGRFKDKVKELDQVGLNPDGSSNPDKGIFGAGGEKVEFNREDDGYPVSGCEDWDESQMVYYPKQYDEKKHGGMSKEDVIKINGTWQMCFVEDMPVIPKRSDEKADVIGGRKRIDRIGSCIQGQKCAPQIQEFHAAMQDKEKMENPAKYKHEKGQTPEQYLWMQLTSLLEHENPVLMDYENGEWRGTYLIESYNIVSDGVSSACWSRDYGEIMLLWEYPDDLNNVDDGVRPSVNIKK